MEKIEPFPPVVRYLRGPVHMSVLQLSKRIPKGRPYGMVVGYAKGMIGWCLCRPEDTFSKFTGRMICYNRAAMGITNWKERLMCQALRASVGVRSSMARHAKWEWFQRVCPRMARIIMLIEEVEHFLSNPGKDA